MLCLRIMRWFEKNDGAKLDLFIHFHPPLLIRLETQQLKTICGDSAQLSACIAILFDWPQP